MTKLHSSYTTEQGDFASYAQDWWNSNGPMALLHKLNPVRVAFLLAQIGQLPTLKTEQSSPARPLAGLRVLDVGCGGGILTESLARLGADVQGIDIEPSLLHTAEQHAQQAALSITYQSITAEELALKNPATFDIVTCFEVLEHVPMPLHLVQACGKLVKDTGIVFFSTPNRTLLSRILMIDVAENLLQILPKGTHDWQKFLKPSTLQKMLIQASLSVHSIQGLHYSIRQQKFVLHPYKLGLNYFLSALPQNSSDAISSASSL